MANDIWPWSHCHRCLDRKCVFKRALKSVFVKDNLIPSLKALLVRPMGLARRQAQTARLNLLPRGLRRFGFIPETASNVIEWRCALLCKNAVVR